MGQEVACLWHSFYQCIFTSTLLIKVYVNGCSFVHVNLSVLCLWSGSDSTEICPHLILFLKTYIRHCIATVETIT